MKIESMLIFLSTHKHV